MPHVSEAIKWGEDLDLDKAPVLTEEELHTLKQRQAAMDKLLAEKQRAKYKIELFFSHEYKSNQHYPGAISLWLSGSKLHGGGDEKIYLCPRCGGFILPSAQGYGHLVCSKCGTVAKDNEAIGEILLRLTTQHWAVVIYNWFRKMEFNADVYVKRPKVDLRVAATIEQARQHGGEKLMAVRQKKEVFIYPLYNIIKDTAGGADLPTRFKALLSA
jgi:ribosomal protein S27AE